MPNELLLNFLATRTEEKTNLTNLSIQRGEFTPVQWQDFCKKLVQCSSLTSLDLSHNKLNTLSEMQWKSFCWALTRCTSLTSLDLSNNGLNMLFNPQRQAFKLTYDACSSITILVLAFTLFETQRPNTYLIPYYAHCLTLLSILWNLNVKLSSTENIELSSTVVKVILNFSLSEFYTLSEKQRQSFIDIMLCFAHIMMSLCFFAPYHMRSQVAINLMFAECLMSLTLWRIASSRFSTAQEKWQIVFALCCSLTTLYLYDEDNTSSISVGNSWQFLMQNVSSLQEYISEKYQNIFRAINQISNQYLKDVHLYTVLSSLINAFIDKKIFSNLLKSTQSPLKNTSVTVSDASVAVQTTNTLFSEDKKMIQECLDKMKNFQEWFDKEEAEKNLREELKIIQTMPTYNQYYQDFCTSAWRNILAAFSGSSGHLTIKPGDTNEFFFINGTAFIDTISNGNAQLLTIPMRMIANLVDQRKRVASLRKISSFVVTPVQAATLIEQIARLLVRAYAYDRIILSETQAEEDVKFIFKAIKKSSSFPAPMTSQDPERLLRAVWTSRYNEDAEPCIEPITKSFSPLIPLPRSSQILFSMNGVFSRRNSAHSANENVASPSLVNDALNW